jgi:hypothetical protein
MEVKKRLESIVALVNGYEDYHFVPESKDRSTQSQILACPAATILNPTQWIGSLSP